MKRTVRKPTSMSSYRRGGKLKQAGFGDFLGKGIMKYSIPGILYNKFGKKKSNPQSPQAGGVQQGAGMPNPQMPQAPGIGQGSNQKNLAGANSQMNQFSPMSAMRRGGKVKSKATKGKAKASATRTKARTGMLVPKKSSVSKRLGSAKRSVGTRSMKRK